MRRGVEDWHVHIVQHAWNERLIDVYIQCYRAKKYHEKIENLNLAYDTRVYSEHVFRLHGTPGV